MTQSTILEDILAKLHSKLLILSLSTATQRKQMNMFQKKYSSLSFHLNTTRVLFFILSGLPLLPSL